MDTPCGSWKKCTSYSLMDYKSTILIWVFIFFQSTIECTINIPTINHQSEIIYTNDCRTRKHRGSLSYKNIHDISNSINEENPHAPKIRRYRKVLLVSNQNDNQQHGIYLTQINTSKGTPKTNHDTTAYLIGITPSN